MTNSKTPTTSAQSEFARSVVALLDSGHFKRAAWARMLGISTSALSQWVNDRTIPRSDLLSMVLDILRTRGGEAAAPALSAFDAMARRPAAEVSPLGARMLPTVEDYLGRASFARLGQDLRGLTAEEKRSVLLDGGWLPAREETPATVAAEPMRPAAAPSVCLWPEVSRERFDFTVPTRLCRADYANASDALAWSDLLALPRSLVVGGPGTGKSQGLQALARLAQNRSGVAPPILDARFLSRGREISAPADAWAALREQPLVLIDGLDEVSFDARAAVVRKISEFSRAATETRFVIASRPTPELSLLDHFERFTIAPLTDLDMLAALTRAVDEEEAGPSLRDLHVFVCHLTERRSLREPLRNPLFLRRAWTLFSQNAVTPFSESEVVSECAQSLLDWDHAKGLHRIREPWASRQQLYALLGELSFHMLDTQKTWLSEGALSDWIGSRLHRAPPQQVVALLLVQGMLAETGGQYRFAHRALQDHFAANYVVESTRSAVDYLSGWAGREDVREVLRLACGIANDATTLIQSVLNAKEHGPSRYALLAEILAQPINAEPEVLEEGCDVVVGWLDRQFEDWAVDSGSSENDPSSRWLVAEGRSPGNSRRPVASCLRAIHRARSGPARDPLKARLEETKSDVLPILGGWMEVEGRIDIDFDTSGEAERLSASIGEVRLM